MIQASVSVRNARLDALEATIGTAPKLYIRSGAAPADCAAGDSGDLLATITLPSDWLAAASGGTKVKAGTWQVSATGAGTAAHFRIKDSTGTTCHLQGSAGIGTGDLQLNTTTVTIGKTITVTSFVLTDSNA